MRTLCFGDAIIDLICRRPVTSLAEADAFAPHLGGVTVNVAVTATRGGAQIALAGGAGDDPWGAWIDDRLQAEGVGLDWFRLVGAHETGLAFVTIDEHGDATYQLHGDGVAAMVSVLKTSLLAAVDETDALYFSSNVLAGKAESALAMAARERALELGHPIVFDPNVRLGRWDGNRGRAGAAAGACVPGAFLVKCTQAEGELMTGETEAEAQAASLLAAGAQHVIVTLGARGAILRGDGLRRDVAGVQTRVLSTVGAGDVFVGVVLARLGITDYYPAAIAAALPEAAREAARACRRWGALE